MSKKEVPETKSKLEQLNQIEHKIADAIKNAGKHITTLSHPVTVIFRNGDCGFGN